MAEVRKPSDKAAAIHALAVKGEEFLKAMAESHEAMMRQGMDMLFGQLVMLLWEIEFLANDLRFVLLEKRG